MKRNSAPSGPSIRLTKRWRQLSHRRGPPSRQPNQSVETKRQRRVLYSPVTPHHRRENREPWRRDWIRPPPPELRRDLIVLRENSCASATARGYASGPGGSG